MSTAALMACEQCPGFLHLPADAQGCIADKLEVADRRAPLERPGICRRQHRRHRDFQRPASLQNPPGSNMPPFACVICALVQSRCFPALRRLFSSSTVFGMAEQGARCAAPPWHCRFRSFTLTCSRAYCSTSGPDAAVKERAHHGRTDYRRLSHCEADHGNGEFRSRASEAGWPHAAQAPLALLQAAD